MMKTAIDVVLLPSAEMTAKAVQINRELLKYNDNKIVLGESCLPHISLCMGVIEDDDLPKVQKILGSLPERFSSFKLTVENLHTNTIPTGSKVSGLRIKDDAKLQELQATVMNELWPYLSYDEVDAQMFYNPPEVEDITFTWVKNYAKKHEDPSLFHPHITVGFGETEAFDDEFPIPFTATTLALCQLGNYCTARKVYDLPQVKREGGGLLPLTVRYWS